jgi:hypothetical protein
MQGRALEISEINLRTFHDAPFWSMLYIPSVPIFLVVCQPNVVNSTSLRGTLTGPQTCAVSRSARFDLDPVVNIFPKLKINDVKPS